MLEKLRGQNGAPQEKSGRKRSVQIRPEEKDWWDKKERKAASFKEKAPTVFLVQVGPQAKRKSLVIFEQLRKARFSASLSFSRDNLRNQLELANKIGAAFALIIGQKEALDGTVIVRDMESGTQESVYQKKVIDYLKRKMKNS